MIHSPEHPIWPLLRFLAVLAAVTIILAINASTFDETEVKTIIELGLIVGGWETMVAIRDRFFAKDSDG